MDILKSQTDESLVKLFAEGCNEAFDTLLNRHKNKIYSAIFYAVRDKDLAEDIFQETFVKVIMTIKQGRYKENGKFSGWVGRIAHNLIIDYFRQEKSENYMPKDNMHEDVFNRKELSEGTIEDEIIQNQIHDDLRRLVNELPDLQRDVLVMRYYENRSFKEIADATGVSINTALGRMRYAILNIRRMAEEKDIVLSL